MLKILIADDCKKVREILCLPVLITSLHSTRMALSGRNYTGEDP